MPKTSLWIAANCASSLQQNDFLAKNKNESKSEVDLTPANSQDVNLWVNPRENIDQLQQNAGQLKEQNSVPYITSFAKIRQSMAENQVVPIE